MKRKRVSSEWMAMEDQQVWQLSQTTQEQPEISSAEVKPRAGSLWGTAFGGPGHSALPAVRRRLGVVPPGQASNHRGEASNV